MQTIVELPEYIRRSEKLLSNSENRNIINYLAAHPKAGDIMTGTGGIRKLRWARKGSGKSSGIRIIYYYHNENIPLFLLTTFGKNEKTNLSKSDRKKLSKFVRLLIKIYGEKK
jgi:hypothetical protein